MITRQIRWDCLEFHSWAIATIPTVESRCEIHLPPPLWWSTMIQKTVAFSRVLTRTWRPIKGATCRECVIFGNGFANSPALPNTWYSDLCNCLLSQHFPGRYHDLASVLVIYRIYFQLCSLSILATLLFSTVPSSCLLWRCCKTFSIYFLIWQI